VRRDQFRATIAALFLRLLYGPPRRPPELMRVKFRGLMCPDKAERYYGELQEGQRLFVAAVPDGPPAKGEKSQGWTTVTIGPWVPPSCDPARSYRLIRP